MDSKKILVADDESHILNVVSLKLRNAGFTVVTAKDGDEAFQLACDGQFDLIITDNHMPNMSGLEMAQKLRSTGRHIPTLMLSARGYHLTEAELQASGIQQMIAKPFSPRQLLSAVSEMLKVAA